MPSSSPKRVDADDEGIAAAIAIADEAEAVSYTHLRAHET